MLKIHLLILLSLLTINCSHSPEDILPDTPQQTDSRIMKYPQVKSDIPLESLQDKQGNILPDFSHIGFMGSEKDIPLADVVLTLEAPAHGEDATQYIQKAINQVAQLPVKSGLRGAILLKKGTYNVQGTLSVNTSGIVLRGEGCDEENGTIIIATGKNKRSLIKVCGTGDITPSRPSSINVKDDYVPVGRFWLTVTNPGNFHVGDPVIIYRPGTQQWISDLKMDKIPPRSDGTPSTQWTPNGYNLISERTITHIAGDTLHFDNPVMMALDAQYGRGAIFNYQFKGRIRMCGVENMLLKSEYASATDEDHAWNAIEFNKVEHSWIRNITSKYFSYGLAKLNAGARFITVKNCACLEAKSIITGGRRYSFSINAAQQCLVIDCRTTEGRHDCVTGSRGVGPNAFVRVTVKHAHSDVGPHHRWNVGTLYDNITTDGQINVQDRGAFGTGHGWAGANQVIWNCTGNRICVQNPWVSARNFSIGTKGTKYSGVHPNRPDGVWVKPNQTVSPLSLFDAQLELRKRTHRLYHSLE